MSDETAELAESRDERDELRSKLAAANEEIERLRAALRDIATGAAWNHRDTARHALGEATK